MICDDVSRILRRIGSEDYVLEDRNDLGVLVDLGLLERISHQERTELRRHATRFNGLLEEAEAYENDFQKREARIVALEQELDPGAITSRGRRWYGRLRSFSEPSELTHDKKLLLDRLRVEREELDRKREVQLEELEGVSMDCRRWASSDGSWYALSPEGRQELTVLEQWSQKLQDADYGAFVEKRDELLAQFQSESDGDSVLVQRITQQVTELDLLTRARGYAMAPLKSTRRGMARAVGVVRTSSSFPARVVRKATAPVISGGTTYTITEFGSDILKWFGRLLP